MYGLYRIANGIHFTGIVSSNEQGIIDYLNKTYYIKWGEDDTRPAWNEHMFLIKKLDLTLV